MGRFLRLIFVLLVVVSPPLLILALRSQAAPGTAAGQSRIDCNTVSSRVLGQGIHYCVLLPPGYDEAVASHSAKRYPVLYFLHGLGENEQTLFETGGWNVIEDLRQQHKVGDFLIVAPEGKRSFYINSASGKYRYNDFFMREFMPYVETKYLVHRDRKSRAITGLSMGGYGALRFAFAYPNLFSAASAQSAALMTESPQELNGALRSGTPLGRLLGNVFGDPIDVPHWQQNDPFLLVKKNEAGVRRLAIYFNCGDRDEYGFEKGAAALDQQLRAQKIKHEFHLYPGNHSFNYFMDHLAETIEFHSRAFESK